METFGLSVGASFSTFDEFMLSLRAFSDSAGHHFVKNNMKTVQWAQQNKVKPEPRPELRYFKLKMNCNRKEQAGDERKYYASGDCGSFVRLGVSKDGDKLEITALKLGDPHPVKAQCAAPVDVVQSVRGESLVETQVSTPKHAGLSLEGLEDDMAQHEMMSGLPQAPQPQVYHYDQNNLYQSLDSYQQNSQGYDMPPQHYQPQPDLSQGGMQPLPSFGHLGGFQQAINTYQNLPEGSNVPPQPPAAYPADQLDPYGQPPATYPHQQPMDYGAAANPQMFNTQSIGHYPHPPTAEQVSQMPPAATLEPSLQPLSTVGQQMQELGSMNGTITQSMQGTTVPFQEPHAVQQMYPNSQPPPGQQYSYQVPPEQMVNSNQGLVSAAPNHYQQLATLQSPQQQQQPPAMTHDPMNHHMGGHQPVVNHLGQPPAVAGAPPAHHMHTLTSLDNSIQYQLPSQQQQQQQQTGQNLFLPPPSHLLSTLPQSSILSSTNPKSTTNNNTKSKNVRKSTSNRNKTKSITSSTPRKPPSANAARSSSKQTAVALTHVVPPEKKIEPKAAKKNRKRPVSASSPSSKRASSAAQSSASSCKVNGKMPASTSLKQAMASCITSKPQKQPFESLPEFSTSTNKISTTDSPSIPAYGVEGAIVHTNNSTSKSTVPGQTRKPKSARPPKVLSSASSKLKVAQSSSSITKKGSGKGNKVISASIEKRASTPGPSRRKASAKKVPNPPPVIAPTAKIKYTPPKKALKAVAARKALSDSKSVKVQNPKTPRSKPISRKKNIKGEVRDSGVNRLTSSALPAKLPQSVESSIGDLCTVNHRVAKDVAVRENTSSTVCKDSLVPKSSTGSEQKTYSSLEDSILSASRIPEDVDLETTKNESEIAEEKTLGTVAKVDDTSQAHSDVVKAATEISADSTPNNPINPDLKSVDPPLPDSKGERGNTPVQGEDIIRSTSEVVAVPLKASKEIHSIDSESTAPCGDSSTVSMENNSDGKSSSVDTKISEQTECMEKITDTVPNKKPVVKKPRGTSKVSAKARNLEAKANPQIINKRQNKGARLKKNKTSLVKPIANRAALKSNKVCAAPVVTPKTPSMLPAVVSTKSPKLNAGIIAKKKHRSENIIMKSMGMLNGIREKLRKIVNEALRSSTDREYIKSLKAAPEEKADDSLPVLPLPSVPLPLSKEETVKPEVNADTCVLHLKDLSSVQLPNLTQTLKDGLNNGGSPRQKPSSTLEALLGGARRRGSGSSVASPRSNNHSESEVSGFDMDGNPIRPNHTPMSVPVTPISDLPPGVIPDLQMGQVYKTYRLAEQAVEKYAAPRGYRFRKIGSMLLKRIEGNAKHREQFENANADPGIKYFALKFRCVKSRQLTMVSNYVKKKKDDDGVPIEIPVEDHNPKVPVGSCNARITFQLNHNGTGLEVKQLEEEHDHPPDDKMLGKASAQQTPVTKSRSKPKPKGINGTPKKSTGTPLLTEPFISDSSLQQQTDTKMSSATTPGTPAPPPDHDIPQDVDLLSNIQSLTEEIDKLSDADATTNDGLPVDLASLSHDALQHSEGFASLALSHFANVGSEQKVPIVLNGDTHLDVAGLDGRASSVICNGSDMDSLSQYVDPPKPMGEDGNVAESAIVPKTEPQSNPIKLEDSSHADEAPNSHQQSPHANASLNTVVQGVTSATEKREADDCNIEVQPFAKMNGHDVGEALDEMLRESNVAEDNQKNAQLTCVSQTDTNVNKTNNVCKSEEKETPEETEPKVLSADSQQKEEENAKETAANDCQSAVKNETDVEPQQPDEVQPPNEDQSSLMNDSKVEENDSVDNNCSSVKSEHSINDDDAKSPSSGNPAMSTDDKKTRRFFEREIKKLEINMCENVVTPNVISLRKRALKGAASLEDLSVDKTLASSGKKRFHEGDISMKNDDDKTPCNAKDNNNSIREKDKEKGKEAEVKEKTPPVKELRSSSRNRQPGSASTSIAEDDAGEVSEGSMANEGTSRRSRLRQRSGTLKRERMESNGSTCEAAANVATTRAAKVAKHASSESSRESPASDSRRPQTARRTRQRPDDELKAQYGTRSCRVVVEKAALPKEFEVYWTEEDVERQLEESDKKNVLGILDQLKSFIMDSEGESLASRKHTLSTILNMWRDGQPVLFATDPSASVCNCQSSNETSTSSAS